MMLRLNLEIDLTDQIKKCSDAFDASIMEDEDFEGLTPQQKKDVACCMDQALQDYFGSIKAHMIGEPEWLA